MKRTRLAVTAVLVAVLNMPAPMRATSENPGPAALGTPRDGISVAAARELAAFRVCAIRLHTALETAKREAANAVIADVSFDGEASRPLYRIRAVDGARLLELTVDADDGRLSVGEKSTPLESLTREDQNDLAGLAASSDVISDAVRIAEKVTSGDAVSGGLARQGNRTVVVIVVLGRSGLQEVMLEPPSPAAQKRRD